MGDLVRSRRVGAEVERHLSIGALQDSILTAKAPILVIFRLETTSFAPDALCAETADQIGEGVSVLRDSEARQLDASGTMALTSDLRVEGSVNVVGDGVGVLRGQRARVIFRHGPADEVGELGDGSVSFESLL